MKKSIKTLLAVTGTLLVVLGIVCLCHPTETLVSLAWLIGLLTLCSGIFSFIFSLQAQRILPNAGTMMLRSILMLIICVFFLSHNAAVTAAIPQACAFWIVFEGTSLTIQSFDFRRVGFPHWWLMLLLGLSGICLGFFAFRQPVATGMTISILIGLGIISNGINRFVALFGISRFEKALEEHKTLLR